MKKNITLTLITTLMILISLGNLFTISTVSAATDPYSYSSEPTRAIYYIYPTMKGNDVKWVQAALNLYGNYGLDIDGSFGPACKNATKKFQASVGLEQDGSFGPITRRKMVEWLNSRNKQTPTVTEPVTSQPAKTGPYTYSGVPSRAIYYIYPTMKGNDVKWVQCALNLYGNYGLELDGSFGLACKNATKKFQASVGLEQDGSFGPITRQKMVEWLNSKGYTSHETSSNKYNLCWPVSASAPGAKNITSSLGNRTAPVPGASVSHKGIDIGVPSGTSVFSACDGIVTGTGFTSKRGNYIVIYHSSIGLTSIYQHLKSINVVYGQTVNSGDRIAISGNTGNVTGPHLHFELVKTSSRSQSYIDCAWSNGAELIDGHYDNSMINYMYKN